MPSSGPLVFCTLSALILVLPAWNASPSPPAVQAAQTPRLIPRTPQEQARDYEAEHRITLSVQVTDSPGHAVTGLRQGGFTVLDNQQPQSILRFREVNGATDIAPPHITLMLDGINDSESNLRKAAKEIEEYLTSHPGPLPYATSVAMLTDSGAIVEDPTRLRDLLIGQLRTLTAGLHPHSCRHDNSMDMMNLAQQLPAGMSEQRTGWNYDCLNRHFNLSIHALNDLATEQMNVSGRDILIWIGPGWPLLDTRGFAPDTPQTRASFFHNLVQISRGLDEAQITLDAISPVGRGDPHSIRYKGFFEPVLSQDKVRAGNLALQALAHLSGGRVFEEDKKLASAITACEADAASYYQLTIPAAVSPADQYHALEVRVSQPGLTVQTATGYYAAP